RRVSVRLPHHLDAAAPRGHCGGRNGCPPKPRPRSPRPRPRCGLFRRPVASRRSARAVGYGDRPPAPLLEGEKIWFLVPAGTRASGRLRLVLFSDSAGGYLQQVADRSDYAVRIGTGRGETTQKGYNFRIGDESKRDLERSTHPHGQIPAGTSWLTREWLYGV